MLFVLVVPLIWIVEDFLLLSGMVPFVVENMVMNLKIPSVLGLVNCVIGKASVNEARVTEVFEVCVLSGLQLLCAYLFWCHLLVDQECVEHSLVVNAQTLIEEQVLFLIWCLKILSFRLALEHLRLMPCCFLKLVFMKIQFFVELKTSSTLHERLQKVPNREVVLFHSVHIINQGIFNLLD